MGEPFLMRALLAGLGLAVVAAPLGCFVVWRRMAYYGEAVAQHPEYARLFGVQAARALALYQHHHDHRHDLAGEPQAPAGRASKQA